MNIGKDPRLRTSVLKSFACRIVDLKFLRAGTCLFLCFSAHCWGNTNDLVWQKVIFKMRFEGLNLGPLNLHQVLIDWSGGGGFILSMLICPNAEKCCTAPKRAKIHDWFTHPTLPCLSNGAPFPDYLCQKFSVGRLISWPMMGA